MNKKIAILLVLAMSASMALAGCTGSKGEETTTSATTAATQASETETSKEETKKSETSETSVTAESSEDKGEKKDNQSDPKPLVDAPEEDNNKDKEPKKVKTDDDDGGVVVADPVTQDDADDKSADNDYYSANTALGKAEVEKFCAMIRDAYIAGDWETLSKYARYPAKVNDKELKDADAFLKYLDGKKPQADSIKAMKKETCKDMYFSGQGICMASGLIWITDANYLTDKEPQLQVFSMFGI